MKVEYKMVELYDEMGVLRNIFDNIELIDPLSGTIIGSIRLGTVVNNAGNSV